MAVTGRWVTRTGNVLWHFLGVFLVTYTEGRQERYVFDESLVHFSLLKRVSQHDASKGLAVKGPQDSIGSRFDCGCSWHYLVGKNGHRHY